LARGLARPSARLPEGTLKLLLQGCGGSAIASLRGWLAREAPRQTIPTASEWSERASTRGVQQQFFSSGEVAEGRRGHPSRQGGPQASPTPTRKIQGVALRRPPENLTTPHIF